MARTYAEQNPLMAHKQARVTEGRLREAMPQSWFRLCFRFRLQLACPASAFSIALPEGVAVINGAQWYTIDNSMQVGGRRPCWPGRTHGLS
jgi:hypothetical protein